MIQMYNLSVITALFLGYLPHGPQHTQHSGSLCCLEPGCDVNIILQHCSQICHTAVSTFVSGLVMASSEEGKRKRDGVSECYPRNPWDALHISVKELFEFCCSSQKSLWFQNGLMACHQSVSSLASFTILCPCSWLVDRMDLWCALKPLIGSVLLRCWNYDLWLVVVLLWWVRLYPTVFFLKEDTNRTNNVSNTNTHSDCRLRLPGRMNFPLTISSDFHLTDLMVIDFHRDM